MAKRKKATKPTAQQIVTVFVPDAVYNLGDGMNELIGKINFLWATPFGVTEVDVSPASALPVTTIAESTRKRHSQK